MHQSSVEESPYPAARIVAALSGAIVAVASTVGGDARWLVAAKGAVGDEGVLPFTVYADPDWPPVLAAPQRLFSGLYELGGERGLQLLQVSAVVLTFALLFIDAQRSGATVRRAAVGLSLVLVGASTSLLIVRLQLFSLALFAIVVLLLRSEARQPSSRVWLLPLLFAVWSNLHGGALVGLAVAGCYLLVKRAADRPRQSLLVLVCSVAALCLTPALSDTPRYYYGVLSSELARQHFGLWSRLDLSSPFDVALLVTAAVVLSLSLRGRPALWEALALLGLAALTVDAARSGVWLLLFAVGAGTATTTPRQRPAAFKAHWAGRFTVLAAATVIGVAIARGPLDSGAERELIDRAVGLAQGSPIATEGAVGEQVALAGGCVWATNPLDAFPRPVQRSYVEWMETGDPALLPPATTVVIARTDGTAAHQLSATAAFHLVERKDGVDIFGRIAAPTPGRRCAQWAGR